MIRLILLVLFLVGCNGVYDVQEYTRDQCTVRTSVTTYSCVYAHSFLFFRSETIKLCNSLEECNKACADARDKK